MNADIDRDRFEILVVEDNRPDVILLRKAFQELRVDCGLHVAPNGDAARAFLRRLPPFADAPRPAIILLDLNLPDCDGQEILEEIKADETLRRIPVVVLSSSQSERDIRQCYDLQANAYMIKVDSFDELVAMVKQFTEFWMSAVKLPPS